MIKAAIVYTSQNGSTKKVAERFKTFLSKKGCAVSLFNVHEETNVKFDDYDLIGFGSPTYMFRPSYEMLTYVTGINNLTGKNIFTFITYGTAIGDGANWLRTAILKKGGTDIGSFNCSGKNLFPGYTKSGYLFSPDGPTDNELLSIESFVEELLLRFKNDASNSYSTVYDPKPCLIYRFQRFVTSRFLIKYFYRLFFTINRNRCIDCGTCSKNCPVNNIITNKRGTKKFKKNCIFCLECEITCPVQAISSPISWFIFKPFLAININYAIIRNIPYKKLKRTSKERSYI